MKTWQFSACQETCLPGKMNFDLYRRILTDGKGWLSVPDWLPGIIPGKYELSEHWLVCSKMNEIDEKGC